MVFNSRKNGIYSCKLAMYVYAASLQAVVGLMMLLSSPNELDAGLLLKLRHVGDVYRLGFDMLQYGGVMHVLLALLTVALIVLSHFVTSLFRLPMFIVAIAQTSYCGMTAGTCFYYLQRGYSKIDSTLEILARSSTGPLSEEIESLIIERRGLLLTVGLLATIMGSMYQRAATIRGDESTTASMVMAPTLSLGMGVAFVLCAPCRDYKTLVLGIFWFLVCAAGEIITTISSVPCLKPVKIALLAIYVAIVLLALVTVSHCAKIYTGGLLDYTSYVALVHGKIEAFADENVNITVPKQLDYKPFATMLEKMTTAHTDEQINMYMGNGAFLLVAVAMSVVLIIFGTVAVLYSVFRLLDVLGGGEPGGTRESGANGQSYCIVIDKR